jgi:NADH-quinone oxidoreductase subunit G
MTKLVNLVIDDQPVQAPEGTLMVDAAKSAGIYIPVFCYHPKMEPVGMCRMCLVEIGRPLINRETGLVEREADGIPKVQFSPKLETACTIPVSEGMVVRGFTDNVIRARKDVLEFLLTSHPLDCPICDKGGECPLQNLTMDFGPGKSRFIYDEKQRLAKHFPLGELIVLDRERCIQCARCVRFQDEIVDDPVIAFSQRGRSLQIVTYSEPGFDSYFSGNTTDICPVGALTTVDFRFQARPWEMKSAASVCSQCPVGCNLTVNVRRENKTGGDIVIKRVMPRQNEWVNEIWICDKGRFAYHYTDSPERLRKPLVRRNGELEPATWDEALDLVAGRLGEVGDGLFTLVSGRLPNEDLFNLHQVTELQGGKAALYTHMAGGDLVAQVGVGQGTNFSEMGPETAIFVVASDLEEEAPVYWLRVKQAADRGARLIVANPRPTKTERYASHVLRYPYGAEAVLVLALLNSLSAKRPELPEAVRDLMRPPEVEAAAQVFAGAQNAVLLFGSEGTSLQSSRSLAQACANLLIATGHVGRANNGLIGVWPRANTQGAWDMRFRPEDDLGAALASAPAVWVAAADPAGDDPALAEALRSSGFLVVQELFLTETARMADVVLPAQAYTEREGTFTSGERRVQRFYPAVPERPEALSDFTIAARIGDRLGANLEGRFPIKVMERLAAGIPDYAGVTYQKLAEVVEQWPLIGRSDLYYGGTSYENRQGLGVQLQPLAQREDKIPLGWLGPDEVPSLENGALLAVPVTRLYDCGGTVAPSAILHSRIPEPYVALNHANALSRGIPDSAPVKIHLNGAVFTARARLDETIPLNIVLVPRSMGIPLAGPAPVRIETIERVAA